MKYFVIQNVTAVTQAQLNYSGVRDISYLKKNVAGDKCVLQFEKENSSHFDSLQWYSESEIRNIISGSDWQIDPENQIGMFAKVSAFFGFGGNKSASA